MYLLEFVTILAALFFVSNDKRIYDVSKGVEKTHVPN